MSPQDKLIKQIGETLRSVHADKNDPTKDAHYWEDFALRIRRHEAKECGLEHEFDRKLAAGELSDILHSIAIHKLLKESKYEMRASFIAGVVIGLALYGIGSELL